MFAEAVVIDDLDQDGDLDVAAGSQGAGIAWWENESLHRSALFDSNEVISQDINYTAWLGAQDLDKDGDSDVVIGTNNSSLMVVENTSASTITWSAAQQIADVGPVYGVAFGDIDSDGLEDIVIGALDHNRVDWLHNPGAVTGTWTSATVGSNFVNPFALGVADLDDDGDLDIVGAAVGDGVSWFENDALSWTEHVIDATMAGAQAAEIGDIDGDGDLDIFSAANLADTMRWWANDGGTALTWTAHAVADGNYRRADLVDFDGDGDLDAVSAGDDLAWWENFDGGGTTWVEHVVKASVSKTVSVYAVDVDADGDQDIVGSLLWNATWWENSTGDGLTWIEHSLPGSMTGGGWRTTIADVNRDGLIDVIGGTWGESNLWWWPNRGGQFALPTTDAVAADHPTEGTEAAVLAIDLAHRGRTGDDDAELATVELLFEASPGTPLAGIELDDIAGTVNIYLDDGDDSWNVADSVIHSVASPFSLSNGIMSVVLPDDNADLQVASGSSNTYFVTLDLNANAATAVPDTVVVTHLTESSSTGEMVSTDLPLTLEHHTDTAATGLEINGIPEIVSPIGNQTATEGQNPSFDASGTLSDPDGDQLAFSASGLPPSLTMTTDGVITGLPSTVDLAGSPYTVIVTATDPWNEAAALPPFDLSLVSDPNALLVDGFETSNTSAWSVVNP